MKATGIDGRTTLMAVSEALEKGDEPPRGFNDFLLVLPPKGEKRCDANRVVRSAEETRPLSLKNSDAKIISGVVNHSLSTLIPQWARWTQRGFVRGRQGLDNVVDLDTAARVIAYFKSTAMWQPLLILFDFMIAFPSIAHEWLFLALKAA